MDQCRLASKFHGRISVPSNTDFEPNISPDGRAVTIIFHASSLEISIEPATQGQAGPRNQTTIQTKVVTLHIPYTTDQPSVTMRMSFHGLVDPVQAEPGVEVRLVVCAGDTTRVVDLSRRDAGGEFIEQFEFTVQPRAAQPVCQITLFLLVERDTDIAGSGGAALQVQALDLEIAEPGQGTY